MIVKDKEDFDVKISGDSWPLSYEFHYFPATQILVHWKDMSNWGKHWAQGDRNPDSFFDDEDFVKHCDFYNIQSKNQSFTVLKLLAERCRSDGRHEVSFKLKQLLEY
jgi:hypothetical protein